MAIPVVIDTDIGDDIDDTWALAMALNSPELDIRLVLTAGPGKHLQRAAIVAKLIGLAGRDDVAIGLGCQPGEEDSLIYQARWTAGYSLDVAYGGTVHKDGVQAMIDLIMAHEGPEPITIIAIGPLRNVAEALRLKPAIAHKCKFVGMHGSIRKGYEGSATIHREYNVYVDPDSCREVLSADFISKTLTPVDTCGLVQLKGARYDTVVDSPSPTAKACIESYRLWSADLPASHPHKRVDPVMSSTVLFDCVAIFLAFSEEWLRPLEEHCSLMVTADGYTRLEERTASGMKETTSESQQFDCKDIRLALEWSDLDAFHDDLVRRIIGPLTIASTL